MTETSDRTGTGLRLGILGALRIQRDGVEVKPGPPQHELLLGILLARVGRSVSVDELVGLLWDADPPPTAVNGIQQSVGALRRLLEPGRAAREPGSYLRHVDDGYQFDGGPDVLDLAAFRELVAEAGTALTEGRSDAALDRYLAALSYWRGPAGEGLDRSPAAKAEFASLDREFFEACVTAAELATPAGRSADVLAALTLATSMAPLHEPVQAALIVALARVGRRTEALAQFERARARLSDELGIAPGRALHAARRSALDQAPPTDMIGRAAELTTLRRSIGAAIEGQTGLVLVEGEPGAGKTCLLEQAGIETDRAGGLVVWGRCHEGSGTPSMWPWVEIVRALLADLPDRARHNWLAGEIGRLLEPRDAVAASLLLPDTGQFRLFETVVALVGESAATRPVLLIVDDLQWADADSLRLFGHLVSRLPAGAVVAGALRTHAPVPGSELTRMLAAASRVIGHRRIVLGPLDHDEVTELVRRGTGRLPASDAVRLLRARTAGNPFFVRELARLLSGDGGVITPDAVMRAGVPATVRDVVRDRLTGLPERSRDVIQLAALLGRTIDLLVLARAAGLEVRDCLHHLDPVQALGLVEPVPDDPYSYRFAHDLIRETISESTPPLRAHLLHLRIAEAIESSRPDQESVAEQLAHHRWAAGPLADPARTAGALMNTARNASAKSALDAAQEQLAAAAQVARAAGLDELELAALSQLIAVAGMKSMYGVTALDRLERAEQLARKLDRNSEAADFLFTRWVVHVQALDLDRGDVLARELRDQGEASDDPLIQAYGLLAWGDQQWQLGHVEDALPFLVAFDRRRANGAVRREDNPLRRDLLRLGLGKFAETAALHGDLDLARTLLDQLDPGPGGDRYRTTIWATHSARIAATAGDPGWALRAAERGMAVDPEFSFVFLGAYQRLAYHWARALTGQDPEGSAAEVRRLISDYLLDPPLSCVATWFGLLAEMRLAAGDPDDAADALDRADQFLEAYRQRYPEGLVLVQRARLLQARGEPVEVVRAAVERAREVTARRGTHVFARRAEGIALTGGS
ncbi:ATP-binding protein [Cryptosporangium phraense]|uniref:AAA family ATPase n=1 Tax=Cryptosporangium phraense TaxID=2593070 RepID=A0A545APT4_9ACTN|nr:BTAD domain-containing putative transcriptional regulator [Cryptosporangium phraense]TQS43316.1 AAA family ATPase [Cryptosporangium phraense]